MTGMVVDCLVDQQSEFPAVSILSVLHMLCFEFFHFILITNCVHKDNLNCTTRSCTLEGGGGGNFNAGSLELARHWP